MADDAMKRLQEEQQKRQREAQQKEAQNKTPTSPPGQGGRVNKALAYTPGQSSKVGVDDRGPTYLTWDEIHELAGDLGPGEIGWVRLDENGTPQGPAERELPPAEEGPVARVAGSPKVAYDDIVTPSGAPVTKFMNPDPQLWDKGMLARNPVPEKTEKEKEYAVSAGTPVVPQPVLR